MSVQATCGRPFACCAGQVFDGEQVFPDAAVLVAGDTVLGVVAAAAVPPGWQIIGGPELTILPGLIDAHVHFLSWQGPHYLAAGVTTVRDTGNDLDWIMARRAEWRDRPWPRLLCVGPVLDGPQPIWSFGRACADAAAGVRLVRELVASRVDGIKLYAGLPAAWLPPIVAAAHAVNLPVAMHCQNASALAAAAAGVDEFFHLDGLLPDLWPERPAGWLEVWGHPDFSQTADRQRRVADEIKRLGIVATPTLAYWDARARSARPGYDDVTGDERLPAAVRQWLGRIFPRQPDAAAAAQWQRALAAAQAFVGLLVEREVPILAGTDVPCERLLPGHSLWRELQLLVESGMPVTRALQAATLDTGRRLGYALVGKLGAGCAADLVLVRNRVLDAIPAAPDIAAVVRGGRVFDADELRAAARADVPDPATEPLGQAFVNAAGKC